ncbi:hypothetical protein CWRG_00289 [Chthonomonas calidirosea]|uniref:putative glycoside hydrolase family 15 protein n=1 Tax=Chthonomonas calidirosea TaxID=454171 RepID=UPI0006DD42DD|nr:putative glycoside hydrolase family 15 protein [Chthonomonas calidirosea]CEK12960.1 hypothetical protein CWRG_00289 [Chthonomonas calidirosea]
MYFIRRAYLPCPKRRRGRSLTIVCVGWILLWGQVRARPIPPIGAEAHPFPDTTNRIVVFADQLPAANSLSPAQWRFIADHYAGTQKETRSWAETIRKLNPHFIILHYQLAVGAGTAAFLDGERWTNDFGYIKQHPHWFLRTADGSPISQNVYHWDVMNILFRNGEPISGWPKYWVETALQRLRDNEDDGVFADSYTQDILMNQVNPPFAWFSHVEACKQNWIPNLNLYGAYCCKALHDQPEHFYYLPNLGGLVNAWDTTNYAVGDGGMNEGFALSGPGNYYAPSDWQLQMNRLLALIRADKIVICQSYIRDSDYDARWFVMGSYLLIKGRHTYINMFDTSTLSWYPEYTISLGAPLSEPARTISADWDVAWGVYRRDFARGMVLVNPDTRPVKIDLGRTKYLVEAEGGGPVPASGVPMGQLKRRPVRVVTIPSHSARILLND